MRIVFGAILMVLVFSIAGAHPVGVPPPPTKIIDLADGGEQRQMPPIIVDGDGDGYLNTADCNDDNAAVNPGTTEIYNGVDDDCDGVIDNGFDTSVDRPTPQVVKMLWPDNKALKPEELISIDGRPHIVRADKMFAVVWSDQMDRLRLAMIDDNGKLAEDKPPIVFMDEKLDPFRARAPDIAWTGTHFGIVYEDTSRANPGIRLLIVKSDGSVFGSSPVAALGGQPKIVWAQDRFGVVWRVPYCAGDCLRFQRFDLDGRGIGNPEILKNSGWAAEIAFSGTGMQANNTYTGSFGIVYEAYYGASVTADVLLTVFPLEPYYIGPEPIKVNDLNYPYTPLGSRPSIAANPTGFAICWHVLVDNKIDGARLRFFAPDGMQPIQEFTLDADAGRASNMVWTGSEFVVVNDNIVAGPPAGFDVHFRRLDPSGNSHLAGGWGPWQEINLSNSTPGNVSVSPHIARAATPEGQGIFGVVWVEQEENLPGVGRIWFANVTHR